MRPKDWAVWKGLLERLWLSGLRLGEALELNWDINAGISVDLTGKFSCVVIAAESEKGFRDRRLPQTVELAEAAERSVTQLVISASMMFGSDKRKVANPNGFATCEVLPVGLEPTTY